MKIRCMYVALLVLVGLGTVAGSALAGIQSPYLTVWYTTNGAVGTTRPGGAGWTAYSGGTFDLANGSTMWFAMDNFWVQTLHKEAQFNLTEYGSTNFFGSGNPYVYNPNVTMNAGWGYDPADIPGDPLPPGGGIGTWTENRFAKTGQIYFSFIYPQPSWEWFSVTNNNGSKVTFSQVDGWSICTPEPSLGLLLLAGIIPIGIGLRRRQRRVAAK